MYENMFVPDPLTKSDVENLASKFHFTKLANGRQPFMVAIRSNGVYHEILLENECGTAVLMFHQLF